MPIQSQRAMPSIAKEDQPEVNQTFLELYSLEERSAVSDIWLVSPFLFINFYSVFSSAKCRHGCFVVSVATSSGKAHEKHSSSSEYLLVKFETITNKLQAQGQRPVRRGMPCAVVGTGLPCNRCPDSELKFRLGLNGNTGQCADARGPLRRTEHDGTQRNIPSLKTS